MRHMIRARADEYGHDKILSALLAALQYVLLLLRIQGSSARVWCGQCSNLSLKDFSPP